MGRNKKPYLENVLVEATAAEGNGLSHVDGKVLFVRGGVPGDVVDVQVNKVRSGYAQSYIVRMKAPSPHRLSPFCAHFGDCGGCTWQTLPYPMQLAFKQQQVADQLSRIGHLELPEVSPILGSEKTDHYRNKLEFTFSDKRWLLAGEDWSQLSAEDRLGLGFHVSGFFDKVLDIQECHLQREPSNAIRLFIKQYAIEHGLSFYNLRENRGFLRTMVVRTTSTGENMLVLCFGGEAQGEETRPVREALLAAVRDRFSEISSLYYVINPKGNDNFSDLPCTLYSGAEAVYEQMEGLRFKIGPKSFYQTNSAQAYRLYSVVRDFVKEGIGGNGRKPVVYDLYTGTGTIALFLSALSEKVVGVEYVPDAIEDAKANARENGIANAAFFAGDMKDVLNADFIAANGRPDIVVLDPPRAGIHPSVAHILLECAPSRMVYVSCNPATQARDLSVFADRYDILHVQPVDMFPHTTHVENVVSLVRKQD